MRSAWRKSLRFFRIPSPCLGAGREPLVREFVDTCPPVDIGRLENARQFHDFLFARRHRGAPMPPYLPDVAACELACATARVANESRPPAADEGAPAGRLGCIRRHPAVVLVRNAYDIRPIFEHGSTAAAPSRRDTPLAITVSPDLGEPVILELMPAVFDLLAALDAWTDPAAFDETPQARRTGRRSRRGRVSSRCAVENLHHRQISADPGRREHAHLLDRACACRTRP